MFPHCEPRGQFENEVKLLRFASKHLRGGAVDTRSKSIAEIEFLITRVIGTNGQNFFFFFFHVLVLASKSQNSALLGFFTQSFE